MGAASSAPKETTSLLSTKDKAAADTKTKKEVSDVLIDDGALEAGGEINIYEWKRAGYLAQYFAVGLIYGGLPATRYGFFVSYLNVPAYVNSAASTLTSFPWSLKILFSLVTDACPIGGYRRRPWMCLGWGMAAVFLVVLAFMPVPDAYYCRQEGGSHRYDLTRVCNRDARDGGLPFALLMCMVAVGYVQADVAADALTVQYARREPVATRGKTQTTAYLTRTVGQICAQLLVGFGMNGREYNGSFDGGLSVSAVYALLAVPAMAMVPISWYLVEEPKLVAPGSATASNKVAAEGAAADETPWTLRSYCSTAGNLLKSALLFEVVCFNFFSAAVGGISTTAGAEVQRIWADVEQLPNQLFSVAGHLLFIVGLWLVRSRYLNVSWRLMTAFTLIISNIIEAPFVFLTVYNVVRNQYFYLEDDLVTAIPSAMNFIVATYVMVEVAEPGTEGITYGLLTTANNVGGPVATALSNWIFGYFNPDLSDSDNYVEDEPSFRDTVALSVCLSYAFAALSLAFLPLLPMQKEDTQARKKTRSKHTGYAVASIALVTIAVLYSFTVNLLSCIPSTRCLEIAGGPGCGD